MCHNISIGSDGWVPVSSWLFNPLDSPDFAWRTKNFFWCKLIVQKVGMQVKVKILSTITNDYVQLGEERRNGLIQQPISSLLPSSMRFFWDILSIVREQSSDPVEVS